MALFEAEQFADGARIPSSFVSGFRADRDFGGEYVERETCTGLRFHDSKPRLQCRKK